MVEQTGRPEPDDEVTGRSGPHGAGKPVIEVRDEHGNVVKPTPFPGPPIGEYRRVGAADTLFEVRDEEGQLVGRVFRAGGSGTLEDPSPDRTMIGFDLRIAPARAAPGWTWEASVRHTAATNASGPVSPSGVRGTSTGQRWLAVEEAFGSVPSGWALRLDGIADASAPASEMSPAAAAGTKTHARRTYPPPLDGLPAHVDDPYDPHRSLIDWRGILFPRAVYEGLLRAIEDEDLASPGPGSTTSVDELPRARDGVRPRAVPFLEGVEADERDFGWGVTAGPVFIPLSLGVHPSGPTGGAAAGGDVAAPARRAVDWTGTFLEVDRPQAAEIIQTITVTTESPLLDGLKISSGTVDQSELDLIPTATDPWQIVRVADPNSGTRSDAADRWVDELIEAARAGESGNAFLAAMRSVTGVDSPADPGLDLDPAANVSEPETEGTWARSEVGERGHVDPPANRGVSVLHPLRSLHALLGLAAVVVLVTLIVVLVVLRDGNRDSSPLTEPGEPAQAAVTPTSPVQDSQPAVEEAPAEQTSPSQDAQTPAGQTPARQTPAGQTSPTQGEQPPVDATFAAQDTQAPSEQTPPVASSGSAPASGTQTLDTRSVAPEPVTCATGAPVEAAGIQIRSVVVRVAESTGSPEVVVTFAANQEVAFSEDDSKALQLVAGPNLPEQADSKLALEHGARPDPANVHYAYEQHLGAVTVGRLQAGVLTPDPDLVSIQGDSVLFTIPELDISPGEHRLLVLAFNSPELGPNPTGPELCAEALVTYQGLE